MGEFPWATPWGEELQAINGYWERNKLPDSYPVPTGQANAHTYNQSFIDSAGCVHVFVCCVCVCMVCICVIVCVVYVQVCMYVKQ